VCFAAGAPTAQCAENSRKGELNTPAEIYDKDDPINADSSSNSSMSTEDSRSSSLITGTSLTRSIMRGRLIMKTRGRICRIYKRGRRRNLSLNSASSNASTSKISSTFLVPNNEMIPSGTRSNIPSSASTLDIPSGPVPNDEMIPSGTRNNDSNSSTPDIPSGPLVPNNEMIPSDARNHMSSPSSSSTPNIPSGPLEPNNKRKPSSTKNNKSSDYVYASASTSKTFNRFLIPNNEMIPSGIRININSKLHSNSSTSDNPSGPLIPNNEMTSSGIRNNNDSNSSTSDTLRGPLVPNNKMKSYDNYMYFQYREEMISERPIFAAFLFDNHSVMNSTDVSAFNKNLK
jgi:hypothetical protein